jgi:hypothetical protein
VFTEEADGRFSLTPLAEHLRADAPGSLRSWAMLMGRPYFFTSWGHLLHSAKTGEPAFPEVYGTSAWEYRAAHPEEGAIFDAAMTGLSGAEAEAVVRSYDFSGIEVLADVGGGHGALLAAILAANPALRAVLFDQPHVVAGAKALLERAGLADRCEVVGGSFFEGVPEGADGYLLKSVIHDWDDAAATKILRKCRAAMWDTGRLLLVERVVRAVGGGADGAARDPPVADPPHQGVLPDAQEVADPEDGVGLLGGPLDLGDDVVAFGLADREEAPNETRVYPPRSVAPRLQVAPLPVRLTLLPPLRI